MKRLLFNLTICLPAFLILNVASNLKEDNIKSEELTVVYLNETSSCGGNKIKRAINGNKQSGIALTNDVDAYVFNRDTFSKINKQNADDYLDNGGVIAVTSEKMDSNLLKDKITIETPDFDFDGEKVKNYQGLYVYNKDWVNYSVNVTAGYMAETTDEDGDGFFETIKEYDVTLDDIDSKIIADQMINNALEKIHDNFKNLSDISFYTGDGEATGSNNSDNDKEEGESVIEVPDTTGQVVATAFLENLLFLEPDNEQLLCSYMIKTDIVDVAKIVDSNVIIHGMYDCRSVFILDAEPGYAVENYTVKMESDGTVVDSSYLNSNTSTTISLGGSFGFNGMKLTGNGKAALVIHTITIRKR